MASFHDILIKETNTIFDAIKIIEEGLKQIALVVDDDLRLIGTINDGDIRRALLKNISLDNTIEDLYSKNPIVANIDDLNESVLNLCKANKIHQIPLVSNDGVLVGLRVIDELINTASKTNKVILMVGGMGERLKPLTNEIPKPMLNVGGKPILQGIVERFVSYGFKDIIMCTGYRSSVVKDFFGDGTKFDANIEYIIEDKRMGTSGALSLLPANTKITESFFVMNGDLLTEINFENLLEFHLNNSADATMCVRGYDYEVPYGVVNIKDAKISSIKEKPVHKFFINAGIYVLNPACLNLIPEDTFFDMTSLFEKMIQNKFEVISFPIREYWLDIGRHSEYKEANNNYNEIF